MWAQLIAWMLKSKIAKAGTGVVGGSGIVALLLTYFNGQIDRVHQKIDKKDFAIRSYVDTKHENVLIEVRNLKEGQTDLKTILLRLDKRLYEMRGGN